MKVYKATLNDFEDIKLIHSLAIIHMNEEENHNQWMKNDEKFLNKMIDYIKSGNFYIVKENEETIGFFAMIFGVDITYNVIDGKWINNDEYVTIHKIASKYYRRHIASFILSYVEQTIANKGIKNIRIDTHIDNVSMNAFLLKNGFVKCGTISITCNFEDKNSLRIAYQKVCN